MEPLQRYFPQILKYLDFRNISPFLISEQLLTFPELKSLEKFENREDQIRCLVDVLLRKGREMYPRFRRALERSVSTDDCSCHLGHVDLLEILPKSAPLATSFPEEVVGETLSGSFACLKVNSSSLQQRNVQKVGEDLTDSGAIVASCEYSLESSLVGDSPRLRREDSITQGGAHPHRYQTLTDILSFALSTWQQIQEEIAQCAERNEELSREKEELAQRAQRNEQLLKEKEVLISNMIREKKEVHYCMQNCLKKVINPNKYPPSNTVRRILSQIKGTTLNSSSTLAVLLVLASTGLSDGETLYTCSQILSALFGLPVSLSSLQLLHPVHIHLFNGDVLEVTILATATRVYSFKQRPDLVIGVYTDVEKSSPGEILAWSRQHDLSSITVQVTLDHDTAFEGISVPVEEGTPALHVIPIHHHLLCLSFHLSGLFADCVERSLSGLQFALVDCNRQRLSRRELVCSDVLGDSHKVAIHELELFCY